MNWITLLFAVTSMAGLFTTPLASYARTNRGERRRLPFGSSPTESSPMFRTTDYDDGVAEDADIAHTYYDIAHIVAFTITMVCIVLFAILVLYCAIKTIRSG